MVIVLMTCVHNIGFCALPKGQHSVLSRRDMCRTKHDLTFHYFVIVFVMMR